MAVSPTPKPADNTPQIAHLFLEQNIRVISYLTDTLFTIRPTARKMCGLQELIDYAASKMHEDLDGIVTEVKKIDRLSMADILSEQNNPKYAYLLVVSQYSTYMLMCPDGIRIWELRP